jgi:hypothetical protein
MCIKKDIFLECIYLFNLLFLILLLPIFYIYTYLNRSILMINIFLNK